MTCKQRDYVSLKVYSLTRTTKLLKRDWMDGNSNQVSSMLNTRVYWGQLPNKGSAISKIGRLSLIGVYRTF